MLKRYCDRCGKEILGNEEYISIDIERMVGQYSKDQEGQDADICGECHGKFKVFMANRDWDVVQPLHSNVLRDSL